MTTCYDPLLVEQYAGWLHCVVLYHLVAMVTVLIVGYKENF